MSDKNPDYASLQDLRQLGAEVIFSAATDRERLMIKDLAFLLEQVDQHSVCKDRAKILAIANKYRVT